MRNCGRGQFTNLIDFVQEELKFNIYRPYRNFLTGIWFEVFAPLVGVSPLLGAFSIICVLNLYVFAL